jgi:amino acid efflux transporter
MYVGALVGPGLLLVPALAVQAAGPASILAWLGVLALSAPLAWTFVTLAVRYPTAEGVAAYVRAAFGETAAGVAGTCFVGGVFVGAPAVALTGGLYVAELTESGTGVAVAVGLAIAGAVLAANAVSLRLSSGVQLALASVLVGIVALAVLVALPGNVTRNWTPFAPHGWWAVGTAANILMWLIFGWEAMAQLAGDFRRPDRDLPRAAAIAFGTITLLYAGLGVATIVVTADASSHVPLADLMAVGFGEVGRAATALLALVLTMGAMNVYVGSSAKLVEALVKARALPRWLSDGTDRDIPRRPLVVLGVLCVCLLGVLAAGVMTPDGLIRATSACFVAVYVLALAAAVRLLTGRQQIAAVVALALVCVVGVFSAGYLLVPALAAGLAIAVRRSASRRALVSADPSSPREEVTVGTQAECTVGSAEGHR